MCPVWSVVTGGAHCVSLAAIWPHHTVTGSQSLTHIHRSVRSHAPVHRSGPLVPRTARGDCDQSWPGEKQKLPESRALNLK